MIAYRQNMPRLAQPLRRAAVAADPQRARVTPDLIARIRNLRALGHSYREISEAVCASQGTVARVITGKYD